MRFLAVGLGLLLVDLLLLCGFPVGRLWVDPLLLFLVFICFAQPSSRRLWLWGLALGFVKDLYSPTLFGGWMVVFAALAWLIGRTRRWVEWEDPAVVGVWASVLVLLSVLTHGVWLTLADPALRWASGEFLSVPVQMAAQGALAWWGFPRLRRYVLGRA